jgi:hypothetical protein
MRDGPAGELWLDLEVTMPRHRRWLVAVKLAAQNGTPVFTEIQMKPPLDRAAPLAGIVADDLRNLAFREIWDAAVAELHRVTTTCPGKMRLAYAGITNVPAPGRQRAGRPLRTREQLVLDLDWVLRKPKMSLTAQDRRLITRSEKAGIGSASGFTDEGKQIIKTIRRAERRMLRELEKHGELTVSQLGPMLVPPFSFNELNAAADALQQDHSIHVAWTKRSKGGFAFDRLGRSSARANSSPR